MSGKYDLIVVGSGPAGSTAAIMASRLGLKVLILDKAQHPRIKPCGGGLTPKSMNLLKWLRIDIDDLVLNECRDVYITNYAGTFMLRSSTPLISVTRREEFDKRLFDEASKGAEYENREVVRVINHKNHVETITRSGETFMSSMVIAADGAPSRVAASLGLINDKSAAAVMTIAKGPSDLPCLLDFTAIRYGYAWIFPQSDGHYDVGLGSIIKQRYGSRLEEYAAQWGLQSSKVLGHLIPYTNIEPVIGRTMFAGDALGVADPTTGEGIYQSMYTGIAAAYAAYASLKRGEEPMIYRQLISNLLSNNRLAKALSLFVYGLDTQFFSRFLGTTGYASNDVKELLTKLISGSTWYGDIIKFISIRMPKYAIKAIISGLT
ncbi:MAG: geranylgeranyl reductase family protein [Thermocladium sp.]